MLSILKAVAICYITSKIVFPFIELIFEDFIKGASEMIDPSLENPFEAEPKFDELK